MASGGGAGANKQPSPARNVTSASGVSEDLENTPRGAKPRRRKKEKVNLQDGIGGDGVDGARWDDEPLTARRYEFDA